MFRRFLPHESTPRCAVDSTHPASPSAHQSPRPGRAHLPATSPLPRRRAPAHSLPTLSSLTSTPPPSPVFGAAAPALPDPLYPSWCSAAVCRHGCHCGEHGGGVCCRHCGADAGTFLWGEGGGRARLRAACWTFLSRLCLAWRPFCWRGCVSDGVGYRCSWGGSGGSLHGDNGARCCPFLCRHRDALLTRLDAGGRLGCCSVSFAPVAVPLLCLGGSVRRVPACLVLDYVSARRWWSTFLLPGADRAGRYVDRRHCLLFPFFFRFIVPCSRRRATVAGVPPRAGCVEGSLCPCAGCVDGSFCVPPRLVPLLTIFALFVCLPLCATAPSPCSPLAWWCLTVSLGGARLGCSAASSSVSVWGVLCVRGRRLHPPPRASPTLPAGCATPLNGSFPPPSVLVGRRSPRTWRPSPSRPTLSRRACGSSRSTSTASTRSPRSAA